MSIFRDAPDISRALRTGYSSSVECFETEEEYFETDDGEMNAEEVKAYMIDYIRTNFVDALDMFGIERKTRKVLCDAYGELFE